MKRIARIGGVAVVLGSIACSELPAPPTSSLGYTELVDSNSELAFPGWALELGLLPYRTDRDPSIDALPELVVAHGGSHSLGPAVVYRGMSPDQGPRFQALHDGRAYFQGLTPETYFHSQIHIADVDPRSPGMELVTSTYRPRLLSGPNAKDSGVFAWCVGDDEESQLLPCDEESPLVPGNVDTFDIADVDADGCPELAVGFHQTPARAPQWYPRWLNTVAHPFRLFREVPSARSGVGLYTFSSEVGTCEERPRLLGFIQSNGRPAVVEFFDTDDDGSLELVWESSGYAVAIADWAALVERVPPSGAVPEPFTCTGLELERGPLRCVSTDSMMAKDVDFVRLEDRGLLVVALDCLPGHSRRESCPGVLRMHSFFHDGSTTTAAFTPQVGEVMSSLRLVAGEDGELLAFVASGDSQAPIRGRLQAIAIEGEHESPRRVMEPSVDWMLPMDLELIPFSANPIARTSVRANGGHHHTLPGAGPHTVENVRVGAPGDDRCTDGTKSVPRCDPSTEALPCWEHAPRSGSVMLRGVEPAACQSIDLTQYPMPVIALADLYPTTGLRLLYPPGTSPQLERQ